ncbi:MAG: ABC transporter permease subunit [Spirochaetales bacterium]
MTRVGKVFRDRNLLLWGLLGTLLVLVWGSALLTGFDFAEGVASFPRAFAWMGANFLPNERAWNNLPSILNRLGETVVVSVQATVLAAVVSFGLALLGSRTTRPHAVFTPLVRALGSLGRNIPVVAWAMIFLLAFGQTYVTGLLALLLESVGFLTRSFLEITDETAAEPVEGLRATGAPWGTVVSQAVIPTLLPSLTSWMLFMLETNIRSATLVGLLTGTGIGFSFDLYYKSLNYPSAALVTLCIVIVVLALEAVSNALRKVIL